MKFKILILVLLNLIIAKQDKFILKNLEEFKTYIIDNNFDVKFSYSEIYEKEGMLKEFIGDKSPKFNYGFNYNKEKNYSQQNPKFNNQFSISSETFYGLDLSLGYDRIYTNEASNLLNFKVAADISQNFLGYISRLNLDSFRNDIEISNLKKNKLINHTLVKLYRVILANNILQTKKNKILKFNNLMQLLKKDVQEKQQLKIISNGNEENLDSKLYSLKNDLLALNSAIYENKKNILDIVGKDKIDFKLDKQIYHNMEKTFQNGINKEINYDKSTSYLITKKVVDSLNNKIKINSSYNNFKANVYGELSSKDLFKTKVDYKVGFNLSIPITTSKYKGTKDQIKAYKIRSKAELNKIKTMQTNAFEYIRDTNQFINKRILSINKSIELKQTYLNELNIQFNQGRLTLNNLIIAEQELLDLEIKYLDLNHQKVILVTLFLEIFDKNLEI
jgi:hypothetical protein